MVRHILLQRRSARGRPLVAARDTRRALGYPPDMEILTWNGADLPEAFRHLPPGRYVVEAVDDAPALTEVQDQQLRGALQAADANQGLDHADAEARLRARLRR